MKTRALGLSTLLLFAAWASPVHAVSTSALSQELGRSHGVGKRVLHFWWLPLEYWVAAAEELRRPAEQIDNVSRLFRNYLIIAVLDVEVYPDGRVESAKHSDIGPKLEIRRNGQKIDVLRDVDPRVARRVAELSYFLTTSLTVMGPSLRIFFLPNLDDAGQPVLQGNSTGTLAITYSQGESNEALRLLWHAPLTSVVGPPRCPEGGEDLEAHWVYCPWHGVKLR